MKVGFAIVFVTDMKRSVVFYRDKLGLSLRFESSHWTEFETGGATLALHLSDIPDYQRLHNREQPGTCRPGFSVSDLDSVHQRLVAEGVECLQQPRDVFGSQVAMYVDPDGLAFSVGEAQS